MGDGTGIIMGLVWYNLEEQPHNNGRQRLKLFTVKKKMPFLISRGLEKKITSASLFFSVHTMFRFLDFLVLLPASNLYLYICSLCHTGDKLEVYQRPSVLTRIVLILVLSCFKSLQFLTILYRIWQVYTWRIIHFKDETKTS